MELVTVIGSDLFGQDEYIKQYLLDPDLPLIFKVKIGLYYYITSDLILQLNVFKNYLEKINPFLFIEVFFTFEFFGEEILFGVHLVSGAIAKSLHQFGRCISKI